VKLKKTSILEMEIREQPESLHRLFDSEAENVAQQVQAIKNRFHYVVIAARGSSDNAARYAQYLFGAYNRLQVSLAAPSLYSIYGTPPNLEGALVIGVSQSGQSPDIIEAVREGRRQGLPTLAITNDPGSPLAQAAEGLIQLQTGPEKAVAASKTYTSSLGALAMLSCMLGEDKDRFEELKRIPAVIAQTIQMLAPVLTRVERYRFMTHSVVIGRGFNYSTAFEIALKIKELTQVITEPYSSADFRHGPISLVSEGFPVILAAPTGKVSGDLHDLVGELEQLGSELLVISDEQNLLEKAHLPLPLPSEVPEWLSPLVAVIPGQLFAMELAQVRGLDPDNPIGLRKVTETL
jgi:glutamine---fructose-6-phosphate transaminase (isomerizing)